MNALAQLFTCLQFLLSLAGYAPNSTEFSNRIATNNHTTLYSTAIAKDGQAKFQCLESSTGVCHYTLYSENCTDAVDCKQAPIQTFSLKRGEYKLIAGLVKFHPCVSLDADPLLADCRSGK